MFTQTLPTATGPTTKVQATATTTSGSMTMGAGGEMSMDWADDGWDMSWGENFMGNGSNTTGSPTAPLVSFPPDLSGVTPLPYTGAGTGTGAGSTQENIWGDGTTIIQNGSGTGGATQENYWDNGDGTASQGDGDQPVQEDALVLRVNGADYTLETSNASLVMNALDNTIIVTPAGTQSHIDGGAGSDTLVLPGASSQFFVQTMPDGSSAIFDQTGVFNVVATNVEQAVFTDKAVTLAAAVAVPEDDQPTDDPFGDITFGEDDTDEGDGDFFSQTPDALVLSQWMQNPFAPFPTAQFVDLVFEHVFQQELGNEEAQYWNNWVYDYIQEPGQFAHLTGLIDEYSEVLFT